MTNTTTILPAGRQQHLPLRVALRLPLVDVAAARAALGVNEDDVLGLIEDGHIAWAWDISTKGAEKREVRILARSVQEFQVLAGRATTTDSALEFEQVTQIVFGNERPFVWGKLVSRALNCGSDHVLNLIRDGSLRLLSGHMVPGRGDFRQDAGSTLGWRRGPNGSPCVSWASAVEFLRRRRLP